MCVSFYYGSEWNSWMCEKSSSKKNIILELYNFNIIIYEPINRLSYKYNIIIKLSTLYIIHRYSMMIINNINKRFHKVVLVSAKVTLLIYTQNN